MVCDGYHPTQDVQSSIRERDDDERVKSDREVVRHHCFDHHPIPTAWLDQQIHDITCHFPMFAPALDERQSVDLKEFVVRCPNLKFQTGFASTQDYPRLGDDLNEGTTVILARRTTGAAVMTTSVETPGSSEVEILRTNRPCSTAACRRL